MCTSSNFRSREPLPSLKNLVLQKDIVWFVMTKKQNISKRATQPIAALYIARNAGLTSKWVFLLFYRAPRPSNEVYYRPQRSCGKAMFLHLSVILFTGGSLSGGSLSREIPFTAVRLREGGTHPIGMYSCCEVKWHSLCCEYYWIIQARY